jgi:hypothetical protein
LNAWNVPIFRENDAKTGASSIRPGKSPANWPEKPARFDQNNDFSQSFLRTRLRDKPLPPLHYPD